MQKTKQRIAILFASLVFAIGLVMSGLLMFGSNSGTRPANAATQETSSARVSLDDLLKKYSIESVPVYTKDYLYIVNNVLYGLKLDVPSSGPYVISVPATVTSVAQAKASSNNYVTEIPAPAPAGVEAFNDNLYGIYFEQPTNGKSALTSIGANAFRKRRNIRFAIMPDTNTAYTINASAFNEASAMVDLVLGNVGTIGGAAFAGLSNLSHLTVPSSARVADKTDFILASCGKLHDLDIQSTSFETHYNASKTISPMNVYNGQENSGLWISADGYIFQKNKQLTSVFATAGTHTEKYTTGKWYFTNVSTQIEHYYDYHFSNISGNPLDNNLRIPTYRLPEGVLPAGERSSYNKWDFLNAQGREVKNGHLAKIENGEVVKESYDIAAKACSGMWCTRVEIPDGAVSVIGDSAFDTHIDYFRLGAGITTVGKGNFVLRKYKGNNLYSNNKVNRNPDETQIQYQYIYFDGVPEHFGSDLSLPTNNTFPADGSLDNYNTPWASLDKVNICVRAGLGEVHDRRRRIICATKDIANQITTVKKIAVDTYRVANGNTPSAKIVSVEWVVDVNYNVETVKADGTSVFDTVSKKKLSLGYDYQKDEGNNVTWTRKSGSNERDKEGHPYNAVIPVDGYSKTVWYKDAQYSESGKYADESAAFAYIRQHLSAKTGEYAANSVDLYARRFEKPVFENDGCKYDPTSIDLSKIDENYKQKFNEVYGREDDFVIEKVGYKYNEYNSWTSVPATLDSGVYSLSLKLNEKWGEWYTDPHTLLPSAEFTVTRKDYIISVADINPLGFTVDGQELLGSSTRLYFYPGHGWFVSPQSGYGNPQSEPTVSKSYVRYQAATARELRLESQKDEVGNNIFTYTVSAQSTGIDSGVYYANFIIDRDNKNYNLIVRQGNDDASLYGVTFTEVERTDRSGFAFTKTWYIVTLDNWLVNKDTSDEYTFVTGGGWTYGDENIELKLPAAMNGGEEGLTFKLEFDGSDEPVCEGVSTASMGNYVNNAMPAGSYTVTVDAPAFSGSGTTYPAFSQVYKLTVLPRDINDVVYGDTKLTAALNLILKNKVFEAPFETDEADAQLRGKLRLHGDIPELITLLNSQMHALRAAAGASNAWKDVKWDAYYAGLSLEYNLDGLQSTNYFTKAELAQNGSPAVPRSVGDYQIYYNLSAPSYKPMVDPAEKDDYNYDSKRREYYFNSIIYRIVEVPTVASATYTGSRMLPNIALSQFYTYDLGLSSGERRYVDAGEYTVTLTMHDKTLSRWKGATENTGTVDVKYVIRPTTNSWTVDPKATGWDYKTFDPVVNTFSALDAFRSAEVGYTISGGTLPEAISFSLARNGSFGEYVTDEESGQTSYVVKDEYKELVEKLKLLDARIYDLDVSVAASVPSYTGEGYVPAEYNYPVLSSRIKLEISQILNSWTDSPSVVHWTWKLFDKDENVFTAEAEFPELAEGAAVDYVLFSVLDKNQGTISTVLTDFSSTDGVVTNNDVIKALNDLPAGTYYLSARVEEDPKGNYSALRIRRNLKFNIEKQTNKWSDTPNVRGWNYLMFDAESNFRPGRPHFGVTGSEDDYTIVEDGEASAFYDDIVYRLYKIVDGEEVDIEKLSSFTYNDVLNNSNGVADAIKGLVMGQYYVYAVYTPADMTNFGEIDHLVTFNVSVGNNTWVDKPAHLTFTYGHYSTAEGEALVIPAPLYGEVYYTLSGHDNDYSETATAEEKAAHSVSKTFKRGAAEGEYATKEDLEAALTDCIGKLNAGSYQLLCTVDGEENGNYDSLSFTVNVTVLRVTAQWSNGFTEAQAEIAVEYPALNAVTADMLEGKTSVTTAGGKEYYIPSTTVPENIATVRYSILNTDVEGKTVTEILTELKSRGYGTYTVRIALPETCNYTGIATNTTVQIKRVGNTWQFTVDQTSGTFEPDGATVNATWMSASDNTIAADSTKLWNKITGITNPGVKFIIPSKGFTSSGENTAANIADFVSYYKTLSAGTYSVNITVPDDKEFDALSATFTLAVQKAQNSWVAPSMSIGCSDTDGVTEPTETEPLTWTWKNGNNSLSFTAPKPLHGDRVTVLIAGGALGATTASFTVTYDKDGNIDAGIVTNILDRIKKLGASDSAYTVTATVAEADDWYGLDNDTAAAVSFKIRKGTNEWRTPSAGSGISQYPYINNWVYNSTAPNAVALPLYGDPNAVTYKYKVRGAADSTASDSIPSAKGEYTLLAHLAGTDDYAELNGTCDFEITAAAGDWAVNPGAIGWEWGGYDKSTHLFTGTPLSGGPEKVTYYIQPKQGNEIVFSLEQVTTAEGVVYQVPETVVAALNALTPGTYTVCATAEAGGNYAAITDKTAAKNQTKVEVRQATNSWSKSPAVATWKWNEYRTADTYALYTFTARPKYGSLEDVEFTIYTRTENGSGGHTYASKVAFSVSAGGVVLESYRSAIAQLEAGTYYLLASLPTDTAGNYKGINNYTGTPDDTWDFLEFTVGLASNTWSTTPVMVDTYVFHNFKEASWFTPGIPVYGQAANVKYEVLIKGSKVVKFAFEGKNTASGSADRATITENFNNLPKGQYTLTVSLSGETNKYDRLSLVKDFTVTSSVNTWVTQPGIYDWEYGGFNSGTNWVTPVPVESPLDDKTSNPVYFTVNRLENGVETEVIAKTKDLATVFSSFGDKTVFYVGSYIIYYHVDSNTNEDFSEINDSKTFSVVKAQNGWLVRPQIGKNWVYGETVTVPEGTLKYKPSGADQVTRIFYLVESDGTRVSKGTAVPTDAGKYVYVVTVKESTNYKLFIDEFEFIISTGTAGWAVQSDPAYTWMWGTDVGEGWKNSEAQNNMAVMYTIYRQDNNQQVLDTADNGNILNKLLALNAGEYSITASIVFDENVSQGENYSSFAIAVKIAQKELSWTGANKITTVYGSKVVAWSKDDNGSVSTASIPTADIPGDVTLLPGEQPLAVTYTIDGTAVGKANLGAYIAGSDIYNALPAGQHVFVAALNGSINYKPSTYEIRFTVEEADTSFAGLGLVDPSNVELVDENRKWQWDKGSAELDGIIKFVPPTPSIPTTVTISIVDDKMYSFTGAIVYSANTDGLIAPNSGHVDYVVQTLRSLPAGKYTITAVADKVANYKEFGELSLKFEVERGTNGWLEGPTMENFQAGTTVAPVAKAKYGSSVTFEYHVAALKEETRQDGEGNNITVNVPYTGADGYYVRNDPEGWNAQRVPTNAGTYILVAKVPADDNYYELVGEDTFVVGNIAGDWITEPSVVGWEYGKYSVSKNPFVAAAKSGGEVTFKISSETRTLSGNIASGFTKDGINAALVAELNKLLPGEYILTGKAAGQGDILGCEGSSRFTVLVNSNTWEESPNIVAWSWDGFDVNINTVTAKPQSVQTTDGNISEGSRSDVVYYMYDPQDVLQTIFRTDNNGKIAAIAVKPTNELLSETAALGNFNESGKKDGYVAFLRALPAGRYYLVAKYVVPEDYIDPDAPEKGLKPILVGNVNEEGKQKLYFNIGVAENSWEQQPSIRSSFEYGKFEAGHFGAGEVKYFRGDAADNANYTDVKYSVFSYGENDVVKYAEGLENFTVTVDGGAVTLSSSVVEAFNKLTVGTYYLEAKVAGDGTGAAGANVKYGELNLNPMRVFRVTILDNGWDVAPAISDYTYGEYRDDMFTAPDPRQGTVSYKLSGGKLTAVETLALADLKTRLATLEASDAAYTVTFSVLEDPTKYSGIADTPISFKVKRRELSWKDGTLPNVRGWNYGEKPASDAYTAGNPVYVDGAGAVNELTKVDALGSEEYKYVEKVTYYKAVYSEATQKWSVTDALSGTPTEVGVYALYVEIDAGDNYEPLTHVAGFYISAAANSLEVAPKDISLSWTYTAFDDAHDWYEGDTHTAAKPIEAKFGNTALSYRLGDVEITYAGVAGENPSLTSELDVLQKMEELLVAELAKLRVGSYKLVISVPASGSYGAVEQTVTITVTKASVSFSGETSVEYTKYANNEEDPFTCADLYRADEGQGETRYSVSGVGSLQNVELATLETAIMNTLVPGEYKITAVAVGNADYQGETKTEVITLTVKRAANGWQTDKGWGAGNIAPATWVWANGETPTLKQEGADKVEISGIAVTAPLPIEGTRVVFTISKDGAQVAEVTVNDVTDGATALINRLKELPVGKYTVSATIPQGVNREEYHVAGEDITVTVTMADNAWTVEPSVKDGGWVFGNTGTITPGRPKYTASGVEVRYAYYAADEHDAATGDELSVLYPNMPSEQGKYILRASYAGSDNYKELSTDVPFVISAADAEWSPLPGVIGWEYGQYDAGKNLFRGEAKSGNTVTFYIAAADFDVDAPVYLDDFADGFTLTDGKLDPDNIADKAIIDKLDLLMPARYTLVAVAAAGNGYNADTKTAVFEVRKNANRWKYTPVVKTWAWDGFTKSNNTITAQPLYGKAEDVVYTIYDEQKSNIVDVAISVDGVDKTVALKGIKTDANGVILGATDVSAAELEAALNALPRGNYYLYASLAEGDTFGSVNVYGEDETDTTKYDMREFSIAYGVNGWDPKPVVGDYGFGTLATVTEAGNTRGSAITYTLFTDEALSVKADGFADSFTSLEAKIDALKLLTAGTYYLCAVAAGETNKYEEIYTTHVFTVKELDNGWVTSPAVDGWTYKEFADGKFTAPLPQQGDVKWELSGGALAAAESGTVARTVAADGTVSYDFTALKTKLAALGASAVDHELIFSVARVENKYGAVEATRRTFKVSAAPLAWKDGKAPSVEGWTYELSHTPTVTAGTPVYDGETADKGKSLTELGVTFTETAEYWTARMENGMYVKDVRLGAEVPQKAGAYMYVTTVNAGSDYRQLVGEVNFIIEKASNAWLNQTDKFEITWSKTAEKAEWTNAMKAEFNAEGKETLYTVSGQGSAFQKLTLEGFLGAAVRLDAKEYTLIIESEGDDSHASITETIAFNVLRAENSFKSGTLATVKQSDNTAVSAWEWGSAESVVAVVAPVPTYGTVVNFTVSGNGITPVTVAVNYTDGVANANDLDRVVREINKLGASETAYTLTASIPADTNWKEYAGEGKAQTVTFTVGKAANGWTTAPAMNGTWKQNESPLGYTATPKYGSVNGVEYFKTADGAETSLGANAPTLAGNYKLVLTVDEGVNYQGLTGEVTFTVENAEGRFSPRASVADWEYGLYDVDKNKFLGTPLSGTQVTFKIAVRPATGEFDLENAQYVKAGSGDIAITIDANGKLDKTAHAALIAALDGIVPGDYVLVASAGEGNGYDACTETANFSVRKNYNRWATTPKVDSWTYGSFSASGNRISAIPDYPMTAIGEGQFVLNSKVYGQIFFTIYEKDVNGVYVVSKVTVNDTEVKLENFRTKPNGEVIDSDIIRALKFLPAEKTYYLYAYLDANVPVSGLNVTYESINVYTDGRDVSRYSLVEFTVGLAANGWSPTAFIGDYTYGELTVVTDAKTVQPTNITYTLKKGGSAVAGFESFTNLEAKKDALNDLPAGTYTLETVADKIAGKYDAMTATCVFTVTVKTSSWTLDAKQSWTYRESDKCILPAEDTKGTVKFKLVKVQNVATSAFYADNARATDIAFDTVYTLDADTRPLLEDKLNALGAGKYELQMWVVGEADKFTGIASEQAPDRIEIEVGKATLDWQNGVTPTIGDWQFGEPDQTQEEAFPVFKTDDTTEDVFDEGDYAKTVTYYNAVKKGDSWVADSLYTTDDDKTGATKPVNVGHYVSRTTVSIVGEDAGNYEDLVYDSAFEITIATDVWINEGDLYFTYDNAADTLVWKKDGAETAGEMKANNCETYYSVKNNNAVSELTYAAFTAAIAGFSAGDYDIVLSTKGSANYTALTGGSAKLHVAKADNGFDTGYDAFEMTKLNEEALGGSSLGKYEWKWNTVTDGTLGVIAPTPVRGVVVDFTIAKKSGGEVATVSVSFTEGENKKLVANAGQLKNVIDAVNALDVGVYTITPSTPEDNNWNEFVGDAIEFTVVIGDNAWLTAPSIANWAFNGAKSAPHALPMFGTSNTKRAGTEGEVTFKYYKYDDTATGTELADHLGEEIDPVDAGTYILKATVAAIPENGAAKNYADLVGYVEFSIEATDGSWAIFPGVSDFEWSQYVDSNLFRGKSLSGTKVFYYIASGSYDDYDSAYAARIKNGEGEAKHALDGFTREGTGIDGGNVSRAVIDVLNLLPHGDYTLIGHAEGKDNYKEAKHFVPFRINKATNRWATSFGYVPWSWDNFKNGANTFKAAPRFGGNDAEHPVKFTLYSDNGGENVVSATVGGATVKLEDFVAADGSVKTDKDYIAVLNGLTEGEYYMHVWFDAADDADFEGFNNTRKADGTFDFTQIALETVRVSESANSWKTSLIVNGWDYEGCTAANLNSGETVYTPAGKSVTYTVKVREGSALVAINTVERYSGIEGIDKLVGITDLHDADVIKVFNTLPAGTYYMAAHVDGEQGKYGEFDPEAISFSITAVANDWIVRPNLVAWTYGNYTENVNWTASVPTVKRGEIRYTLVGGPSERAVDLTNVTTTDGKTVISDKDFSALKAAFGDLYAGAYTLTMWVEAESGKYTAVTEYVKTFEVSKAQNSWTVKYKQDGWQYELVDGQPKPGPAPVDGSLLDNSAVVTYTYYSTVAGTNGPEMTGENVKKLDGKPVNAGWYLYAAKVEDTVNYLGFTDVEEACAFNIVGLANAWDTAPADHKEWTFGEDIDWTTPVARYGTVKYTFEGVTYEDDQGIRDALKAETVKAGTYTVKCFVTSDGNYDGLSNNVTVTVNKRAYGWNFNDGSKVTYKFDSNNFAWCAFTSDKYARPLALDKNGDDAGVTEYSIKGRTIAGDTETDLIEAIKLLPKGNYTIVVSASGLDNYSAAVKEIELEVTSTANYWEVEDGKAQKLELSATVYSWKQVIDRIELAPKAHYGTTVTVIISGGALNGELTVTLTRTDGRIEGLENLEAKLFELGASANDYKIWAKVDAGASYDALNVDGSDFITFKVEKAKNAWQKVTVDETTVDYSPRVSKTSWNYKDAACTFGESMTKPVYGELKTSFCDADKNPLSVAPTEVGTYYVAFWVEPDVFGNFEGIDTVYIQVTVKPIDPDITMSATGWIWNKYNVKDNKFSFKTNSPGNVSFKVLIGGSIAIVDGVELKDITLGEDGLIDDNTIIEALKLLPAGDYTLTATVGASNNYNELSESVEFTVTVATNTWIKNPSIVSWTQNDYSVNRNFPAAVAEYGDANKTFKIYGAIRKEEAGKLVYVPDLDKLYYDSETGLDELRSTQGDWYVLVTAVPGIADMYTALDDEYPFQVFESGTTLPANIWFKTDMPKIEDWSYGSPASIPSGSARRATDITITIYKAKADNITKPDTDSDPIYSKSYEVEKILGETKWDPDGTEYRKHMYDRISIKDAEGKEKQFEPDYYVMVMEARNADMVNDDLYAEVPFRVRPQPNGWITSPQINDWYLGDEPSVPVYEASIMGEESERTVLFRGINEPDSKLTDVKPTAPGEYVMVVEIKAHGTEPLKSEAPYLFKIDYRPNKFDPTPTIEKWVLSNKVAPEVVYGADYEDVPRTTIEFKAEGEPESAYSSTKPDKPGTYDVRVTVYHEYCEPLIGYTKFTVELAKNSWLESPNIKDWSEEFDPNDPTAVDIAGGTVTYVYTTMDGTKLDGKPTEEGEYYVYAIVEADGYETLTSDPYYFVIDPAFDWALLLVDIILGLIGCALCVVVIIFAIRRHRQ